MWPFEYKYNVQCFWLKRILNIITQAGIFRDYRNTCFWRPKCFGKAIPQIMTLWILSGNGALQIMPFRKLGGKCHFFLRFCTRKRSKTYVKNEIIEMKGKFCLKYHRNVIQVHVYNKKIGFNVFILRDLKCPRSWFVSHIYPNLWYLK